MDLPHSREAEQSVIGAILIDSKLLARALESVNVEDFYFGDNKAIFEAMIELDAFGTPIDVITVGEQLDTTNKLDQIGGLHYLIEINQNTPSSANYKAYAGIVKERSLARQVMRAAGKTREQGQAGVSSDELIADIETDIAKIIDSKPKKNAVIDVNALLSRAVDNIEEMFQNDGGITGLSTGLTAIDDMTSGMQKSELLILAARPSMGKTSLAMNIVENVILNQDKPVIVFSMEMPCDSIIQRMISSIGRIDLSKLRSGKLFDTDWTKLSHACAAIKDRPVFIDDAPALSPHDLRIRTRKIEREQGEIALIAVDYLQLMSIPNYKGGRVNEVTEISRSLKALAKEFNCPVLALSQLNRGLEQRPNKRPINSDLRESGAIEQDADVIMFIYRDEVYNPDSSDQGIAEIIFGKQRNGPIGVCRLGFEGRYTKFSTLTEGNNYG